MQIQNKCILLEINAVKFFKTALHKKDAKIVVPISPFLTFSFTLSFVSFTDYVRLSRQS